MSPGFNHHANPSLCQTPTGAVAAAAASFAASISATSYGVVGCCNDDNGNTGKWQYQFTVESAFGTSYYYRAYGPFGDVEGTSSTLTCP